jgi:hypothetical protein
MGDSGLFAWVARLGRRRRRRRDGRESLAMAPDLQAEPEFLAAYERCRAFTMTSLERMHALWQAARHVARARVEGDVVECGVWKGGSSMLAALALKSAGDTARSLWLYDTFTGMSEPTAADVDFAGKAAGEEWSARASKRAAPSGAGSPNAEGWCEAPVDAVKGALASTGYPADRLHFVAGKVEETIPARAPAKIALLRLDTDWYESTRHELEHLWPRLSTGGVLIVDDYGHWQGARRAVDEYFAKRPDAPLLTRVDYTGRVAIKTR